jgi:transcriptional regulator with XRE-family HTH domain
MSNMPTIEEIAVALQGMTQEERRQLGDRVGVPFDTLQKIALRQTLNPRVQTFLRLSEAISNRVQA